MNSSLPQLPFSAGKEKLLTATPKKDESLTQSLDFGWHITTRFHVFIDRKTLLCKKGE